jgi:Ca2+-binding EF-hand superfamily protein
VEPAALRIALAKLTQGIDQETIDRFVRFLDKDTSGKINYVGFLESMNGVSNRDHNPFKSVVQRLEFFIVSNKQTVESLVTRLIQKSGTSSPIGIPVAYFAEFLKAKIDKKRNYQELDKYARYMDIDKDGLVSEIDIQTCIDNL